MVEKMHEVHQLEKLKCAMHRRLYYIDLGVPEYSVRDGHTKVEIYNLSDYQNLCSQGTCIIYALTCMQSMLHMPLAA